MYLVVMCFSPTEEDASLADVVELDDPGEMPTLYHHNHHAGDDWVIQKRMIRATEKR